MLRTRAWQLPVLLAVPLGLPLRPVRLPLRPQEPAVMHLNRQPLLLHLLLAALRRRSLTHQMTWTMRISQQLFTPNRLTAKRLMMRKQEFVSQHSCLYVSECVHQGFGEFSA